MGVLATIGSGWTTQLLLDVGQKGLQTAKAKDGPAMEGLSDELYNACVTCHEDYRPRTHASRPVSLKLLRKLSRNPG